MIRVSHHRLRALLLASVLAMPAAHARAEEAAPVAASGDDIVVTARYRAESLQQVPIAITALSGAALNAQGLHNLQDISQTVPAVDFRNGSSNKDRTIFVRGIGTISTSPGVEPSVSTVIDGVVLTRPGQSTLDLGEIERIEVLQGPQGTLFGKNASAGVINVVSAAPSQHFHAYGEATATTDAEFRVKAGATGGLATNLAGSLDGIYTHYRGNVDNIATGDKVNGFERYGVRGKLQFTPTDALKLTLSGDYLQSHDTVPNGVFSSLSTTAYGTGVVSTSAALASALPAAGVNPSADNRTVNSTFDSDVHDKNYGTSLNGELKLADGYTVTSITALRGWKNHQHQDFDQTNGLSASVYQAADLGDLSSSQFSQELRLTSPKGKLVDYVVGAYYLHARDDERYQRDLTKVISGTNTPYEGVANYGTSADNYALFGEANLNITKDFRAIAGYRSTWDDLSFYHNRTSTNDPTNSGNSALAVTGIQAYHKATGSTSRRGDSYRLGLQYDLAPATQAYVTYSRGYKGPAYNVFFNMLGRDELALTPETSKAWEAGLKGSLAGRKLTYALAAYSTVFDNYQANFSDLVGGAIVSRLINAGRVGTRGLEGQITWRPVAGLSFDTSVNLDDAKILHFNCPAGAAANCSIDGQALPYAPKFRLSENAAYRFALTPQADLELQTDLSYRSSTQYQLTETPNTIQPAYAIWNASLALLGKDGWQARVFVKNITNQHYSDYLANGNIGGTLRYVPRDDARFAGISLRKDF